MASITRLIRQTIEKALEDETTSKENTLHDQFESFKKTLLPNLDDKGFADLYSQTIAYGLFTARCFDNQPPFTRQEAAYLVPKTNPFLRDTFDRIAGIHLDERIVWAVDDLATLKPNRYFGNLAGFRQTHTAGRPGCSFLRNFSCRI